MMAPPVPSKPAPKRRRRLALAILALAVTATLTASWALGSRMSAGHASDVPPATAPARDFQLTTPDDITLAARYRPGARPNGPAVLLLHATDGSRGSVEANAAWLASLGYAVLTIDFRGHGASTVTSRSLGYNEAIDAHAAFDWLKRQQGDAPVAVIGISLGGAASLLGEAGPLAADAFVLQAVYPDVHRAIGNRLAIRLLWPGRIAEPLLSYQSLPRFGIWPSDLSPVTAIRQVRAPILVIGGNEDQHTPPEETRMLFHAAPGRKALYMVPQGEHDRVCASTDDAYRHQVADFLRRTIGEAR